MSDIITTVVDYPVTISVTETPIVIITNQGGLQGPPGPPGTPGSGGGGTVSVSGYATSGDLYNTGHILLGLITSASAGISSINSQSGILNFTGAGSLSVLVNGQNFIFSGNTGYLINYATTSNLTQISGFLQNEINNTSISNVVYQTGNQIISGLKDFSSGISVSFISGDSHYIGIVDSNGQLAINWNSNQLNDEVGTNSIDWNERILKDGIQNYSIQYNDRFLRDSAQNFVLDWNNKLFSGNWTLNSNYILTQIDSGNIQLQINSINNGTGHFITGFNSGLYVTTGQTGNLALVNNLFITGSNLYNDILGLSGVLNSTGITIQNEINNLNNSLFNTGQNLYANIISASGNLQSQFTPVVTGISIAGSTQRLTGYVTFAGGTDIFVGQNSNGLVFNSTATYPQTGQALYNLIVGLSGQDSLNYSTISNLGLTGQFLYSNYTGLSGALYSTGSILQNRINSLSGYANSNPSGYLSIYNQSGSYIFSSQVISGSTQQFVTFPTPLGPNPYIIAYLNGTGNSQNISVQATGISSNGYWATYSNSIPDNNYLLTTLASLSAQSNLATTVFVNIFTGSADGLNLSGNLYSTGNILYNDIIGLSGILANSGISLQNNINTLKTNLTQTGILIDTQINLLSGYLTGYYLTGIIAGSNITVNNNNNGTFTVNSTASGGGGVSISASGSYMFQSAVISGVFQQFVQFPTNLGINPYVICELSNNSGTKNILAQSSGIVSSGFWANYSDLIDNSGYLLTTFASISTSTGLATTVIVNSIPITAWGTLAWNNNIVWNVTQNIIEDKQILILTGNANLGISGLYNGWCGALKIVQSGFSSTGYNLLMSNKSIVINGGSGLIGLTMTSGAKDVIGFTYDGIDLMAAIGNNFT